MRLAVYSDDPYRRRGDRVEADMSFALFPAAMAPFVERLTIAGRLAPEPVPTGSPLPADVEFVALPWWEDMSQPRTVAAALPQSVRRFWRLLDDVDAVWLLGPSPFSLLFALLAWIRRRRVAIGIRMSYPDYVRHRHPERASLHRVADVLDGAWRLVSRVAPTVVVGSDLARRYRRARRLLNTPVSIVPADEVVGEETAHGRDFDGVLRVLSVGRVDVEKNPLLLADVLAALRSDDDRWQLVVCGDGPLLPALEARLHELGVAEHAELRGHVPARNGLRDLYLSSHMFLHVSWTEGVPQVLFEAFAAGLPTVATDVGGVLDATGADAALLIGAGDAAAATAALRRIAADPARRRALVDAALAQARAHTIDADAARVVRFVAGAGR